MGEVAEAKKLRIGFIHPDLGIGGAERLVVDAAVALQKRGHDVTMFTSRHDPKRCFEETRNGTLKVHVLGSTLPQRLSAKYPLTIIFSMLRSLFLTILLSCSLLLPGPASGLNPLSPIDKFDVFFVDQQSVCIPLLRLLTGTRVVFYCHFPDKLLSEGWEFNVDSKADEAEIKRTNGIKGESLLKRIYRWPIDKLEELTTGQSDIILSNSLFTSKIYTTAFPSLAKQPPRVVYPCIDLEMYKNSSGKGKEKEDPEVTLIASDRPTFVSLNRFEHKKNAALAIKAFARLATDNHVKPEVFAGLRLVIAGGYDEDLQDNVRTLRDLIYIASTSEGLSYDVVDPKTADPVREDVQVIFLLNFTTAQRTYLLTSKNTLGLLYTPSNEHFGIVPVEAMACGLPVIAVNSGGPTETIVDLASSEDGTGYLLPPDPKIWAGTLASLIRMSVDERKRVAASARQRAEENFSIDNLGLEIEQACRDAVMKGDVHRDIGNLLIVGGAFMVAFAGVNLILIWYLYANGKA